MKSTDWKRVKVHQWLILAREDVGAVKCEVIEVDVKVVEELPTYHYEYPYGLTAEKGTVTISYAKDGVIQVEVENLADLITYLPSTLRELEVAYEKWQTYKSYETLYREGFNTLVQNRKAE